MNHKAVGELSEAVILSRLLKKFKSVSLPFGNNQRYDMILDDGKSLLKVQCKTGSIQQGAVIFDCHNRSGPYTNQIDYFAVYCPENDKAYLIPASGLSPTGCSLRLEPTKNKQIKGVRFAEEFEI